MFSRLALHWPLLIALLLGSIAVKAEPLPRGTVLPLQDRVGDPDLVSWIQRAIEDEMQLGMDLTSFADLRGDMRRLRIRDAGDTSPSELRAVAEKHGVTWVLVPTLHGAGANPRPWITVLAWAARIEDKTLSWAGFRSASGLDTRRAFGRGVIGSPEVVAATTARQLVREFRAAIEGVAPERRKVRAAKGGYLLEPLTPDALGIVAILPFHGVTDRRAGAAAETLGAIARAVLYREGVTIAHPGAVGAVLRRRGIHSRNELDATSRAAIGIAAGADHLITGSVEAFDNSGGLEPNPLVEFSARIVEVETGRVIWANARETTGWKQGKLFAARRTYTAGTLAEMMMRSLAKSFLVER